MIVKYLIIMYNHLYNKELCGLIYLFQQVCEKNTYIWHIWRMHSKQIFKRKEFKKNWINYWRGWVLRRDPDARKDWGQEEKGARQDAMAGWHHRPNGHESEQTPGAGEGQGSLARCSPWGQKQSNTTEWMNWTELNWTEEMHCKRLAAMNCTECLVTSH